MSKVFKIGIFGLGHGGGAAEIFSTEFESTTVSAVCEKDPEKVEKARRYLPADVQIFDDFDEFIKSDLDAVYLANYFHEHAKFAIKAMEAGVAVLSETTAAPTLGECVDLVETAERTNGKYMLAANCLYFPAVHAMKPMIEKEEYGKVLYAEAEYIHGTDAKSYDEVPDPDPENIHWRYLEPTCMYNMHTLGPLMYITGTTPVKVMCKAFHTPDFSKETKRYRDSEGAVVITEMDNGAIFNTTGCNGYHPNSKWYRVACEHGTMETVRYDQHEDLLHISPRGHEVKQLLFNWRTSGAAPEGFNNPNANKYGHGGIDYFMCYYFKEYLEGKIEPFLNVYRAAALSATGILAWYSALTGKEYDVPDFTKKEDRDKIRNDYRTPFAKKISDATLPFRLADKDKFEDLF